MNTIKKLAALLTLVFVLCLVSGCVQERTSGKGLYLPPGNIEKGRMTFIELRCHRCHTLAGVDLPPPEPGPPELETPAVKINLGGEIYRVKTYGELVTSITNPNHIISPQYLKTLGELAKGQEVKSLMPSFNDEMTVAQLIDLVTFLDAHYTVRIPDYTGPGIMPY